MSAILSPCGTYRYRLERGNPDIRSSGTWAVIMVNPSTADATENDPTIRKLIGFATRANIAKVIVGNLFAYRATDIKALRTAKEPAGPSNFEHLETIIHEADVVIAAWGTMGKLPKHLREAWRVVDAMASTMNKPLMCWSACDDGHPRHPLMLSYSTPLTEWHPPK